MAGCSEWWPRAHCQPSTLSRRCRPARNRMGRVAIGICMGQRMRFDGAERSCCVRRRSIAAAAASARGVGDPHDRQDAAAGLWRSAAPPLRGATGSAAVRQLPGPAAAGPPRHRGHAGWTDAWTPRFRHFVGCLRCSSGCDAVAAPRVPVMCGWFQCRLGASALGCIGSCAEAQPISARQRCLFRRFKNSVKRHGEALSGAASVHHSDLRAAANGTSQQCSSNGCPDDDGGRLCT
jgi:hypothetical protein